MEFFLASVELLLQFCVFFVRLCRPRPEAFDILPRNQPRNLGGADPTRADFHCVYLVFQLLLFASLAVVVVFFSLRRWPYIDYAILLTSILFDSLLSAEIDLHTCYSRFHSRDVVEIQFPRLRCAATYTGVYVCILALTSAMVWAPRPLNVTLVITGSSLSLTFTIVAVYHLKAYGSPLSNGQAAVAWLRALFLIINCLLVLHFPALDLKLISITSEVSTCVAGVATWYRGEAASCWHKVLASCHRVLAPRYGFGGPGGVFGELAGGSQVSVPRPSYAGVRGHSHRADQELARVEGP